MGKQSVRATFKLSKGTIHALSLIASHLGLKQKSLFDHLIGDTAALETIAREIKKNKLDKSGRVQKTIVISRQSLSILERMAQDYKTPRDALVEFSIQRLKPIIEQEKEKLVLRKQIAANIKKQLKQQQVIVQKVKDQLGPDDPVLEKLEHAVDSLENTYCLLSECIRRGEKSQS